ncbi:uncharacterized protein C2orf42 [Chelonus insularis]|uniref:uncharacterized protein C2orf42 n=1 Tax=Chelonus insularis TaxID=460826 RepID=UPI00158B9ED1|nr:uncharacterized protein C2orf42 [Chelonus insularis]
MSNEDRLRTLFSDLGKATLRGVKKCPKCGTYNGSRGLCCKNKYCDAVFKEPGERRKMSTEACKLITGSSVQVFSVRVRDKGPDCRGFVQVPVNATIFNDSFFTSPTSALCLVDNCEKTFDTNVLKCHEKNPSDTSIPTCQHIQAALKCYAEAQPLTVKNSILRSMNVLSELKQEIWLLATETPGPLVQRVSKNIMAVKCKVSPKHPLGYLHLSFYTTKVKDKVEHKYNCSCTPFKQHLRAAELQNNSNNSNNRTDLSQTPKRCVHFYSCICAFASDVKLADEFEYYINIDENESKVQQLKNPSLPVDETDQIVTMDFDCLTDDSHLLIFRDETLTVQNFDGERLDIDYINLDAAILSSNIVEEIDTSCQRTLVEENNVINQTNSLGDNKQSSIDTSKTINSQLAIEHKYGSNEYVLDEHDLKLVNNKYTAKIYDGQTLFEAKNIKILEDASIIDCGGVKVINDNLLPNEVTIQVENSKASSVKRKRDDEKLGIPYLNLNNLNLIETKKVKTKPTIIKKHDYLNENVEEENVNLSFIKWLASVTERINQTMHFQFDGKPEPLVFHVPQIFFDCLRERISCGGKKKRLPNSTTAFVRKDGIPLGIFTKYTWQITNILHVKSIFETSLIPLEITRSFIQNADGTYDLYKRQETDIDKYKKMENSALIKPSELKTYLKVGKMSPNQVDPTPFLIEWIPDILPISKIGELRIRFEFGHVNNETPDRWKTNVASSKTF